MINPDAQTTLDRLLALVERLYLETAGFIDNGENQQHWYNRGYANGVVKGLTELGYRQELEQALVPDPENMIEGHEFWAWGKAYLHGMEVGEKETREVMSVKAG